MNLLKNTTERSQKFLKEIRLYSGRQTARWLGRSSVNEHLQKWNNNRGNTAFLFIGIFYVIITIPCVGVAWIGKNLIDQLGRFPSKTPAIQMSVLFKLVILEMVSFTLILAFFKILVAE